MKNKILMWLVELLLAQLSPDIIKKGLDSLLDIVEDAVEDSSTTIDDRVVLPICKMIREALDIPDND